MSSAFIADVRRYCNRRGLTLMHGVSAYISYPGLQALFAYRIGRKLLQARRRIYLWPLQPFGWLLYFLTSRYARLAFDIHLDLSADIGPGLHIGHFGNIRIEHCKLGAHCSIAQSVHVRPRTATEGPVVGDRVWIGAHAQIVGAYVIGAGSTISAGGIVQKDVPENTLCLGNPARVIIRNYDNRAILGIKA